MASPDSQTWLAAGDDSSPSMPPSASASSAASPFPREGRAEVGGASGEKAAKSVTAAKAGTVPNAPRTFRRGKVVLGAGLVALFVLMALAGPLLAPYNPTELVAAPHQPPSWDHWMGTTGQGQDVFSQTIAGARTTLAVAFGTGIVVTVLGAVVGMTAAYARGWVDEVLSLFNNVFLIMPGLPLAVVVAAYLPPGPWSLACVLILTGWAWNARVIRSQMLTLREREFVAAAVVSGESPVRIVFAEILPSMTPLLASTFISSTVYAVGAEMGLEFIGVGDLSAVTWGTNLYWASNNAALLTGAWWTVVPTGLCVAVFGFALTLLNFAIDEATNPRIRAREEWRQVAKALGVEGSVATPVVKTHE